LEEVKWRTPVVRRTVLLFVNVEHEYRDLESVVALSRRTIEDAEESPIRSTARLSRIWCGVRSNDQPGTRVTHHHSWLHD